MSVGAFQRFWITVAFLSSLLGFLIAGDVYGLETYVIGGEDHPWREYAWDEADPGALTKAVDFDEQPGWITLKRIDPTENIAAQTYERGGRVTVPNIPLSAKQKEVLPGLVNGDSTVALEMKSTPAKKVYPYGVLVDLDLGARFGVNRIRFFPRMSELFPFQDDFMRGYEIYLNDGTKQTADEGGRPIFKLIRHEEQNSQPVVDFTMPLQYVRYIRLRSLSLVGWELDEIQVFGAGFVPEATYESLVFDFEDLATFGKLWWSQEKVGDVQRSDIVIRTRSGNDDTPLVYYRKLEWGEEVEVSKGEYERLDLTQQGEIRYFTKEGAEISKRDYEWLRSEDRGDIKYYRTGGEIPFDTNGKLLTKAGYDELSPGDRGSILLDRENGWSDWSPPYEYEEVERQGGIQIVSPAPRRYLQFRIDLESRDLETAGSVGSLGFQVSTPPVAQEILAEIAPGTAKPGALETFTYAVRPVIREGDTGFDRLEIETPTRVDTVQSVRIDGEKVNFKLLDVTADHFTVGFPRMVPDQVLTLTFVGMVLTYGTPFSAKAFDSETGELKQSVIGGDATPDIATNGIFVDTRLGGSLIVSLVMRPNPFTPNGDGVNDDLKIRYDLIQLGRKMPVSVKVYDLSGSLVRTLYTGRQRSGIYTILWDGKAEDGAWVSPGVYIVGIRLETDSGVQSRTKAISVVY